MAHPGADLYGSDRMMLESVEGFRERGWDVVVAVPTDGPLVAELRRRDVQVVLCPSPVLRKSFLRPLGLLRLAAASARGARAGLGLLRRSQADVVYVSTLTVPLWLLLARLVRRPAVCHVHEAEGSAPAVVRWALALPLRLARGVVVNSRYSLDVLAAGAGGAGRRAAVVYNGVPGPEHPSPPRASPGPPVRLLYVGRLSPRKGVDVAVAALAELLRRGVPARLDVVGDVFPGYEWYEADLRRQAAEAGPPGTVTFHGFRSDVWPFAAAADVMVVPSRLDEPFGNTAVEAALAARPLVVSDTSGLREAAAGLGAARVGPPDDAPALASAVEQVLADWPGHRERAVQDAAIVRDRHDPRRYRRAVADVVAGVLPAPEGAAVAARPHGGS